MKQYIYPLVALFFISIGVQAQIDRSKQPEPGPSPKITLEVPGEFQLKNGLKVLVVENHKLPRVSYSLNIDNKPIKEGQIAGVSQLFGSMMGKGSDNISKDDFNEEIDFLGASLSFRSNGAYARALSKYSERILELMADAAINPVFNQDEFDKEKEKAIESIKSGENSVATVASRVGSALAYGTHHPYGEFVTETTLNKTTLNDVKTFYQEHFNPSNAYLVVVGDVKFNDIKQQVKKYFGKWQQGVDMSYNVPDASNNVGKTQIDFVDMPNAVQSNISLTHTVDLKMNDPDYHALLIANKILGGGFNSYLNMNLREAHGYTYGARSSLSADKYIARFSAGASVRNAVTDSAVVETLKEIKRIKDEPVSAEDLANAKAKYVGDFVLALENPQTIARYALNTIINDLPEDFYSTYLQKINAVTTADVKRVANKYFKPEHARFVVVGKGSDVLENLEKTGLPIKYYDKYANPTEKPEAPKEALGVDAKTVLSNYIKAIGGKEKLDNVTSLILKYEANAMGSTLVNEEKKVDHKMAQTVSMNGAPMMKVIVTQETAFMKRGEMKQSLPENMAKDMTIMAGLFLEKDLLNSDSAKLSGIENIDGKDAYKIDVAGEVISVSLYYDVKTGLKVKEVQTTSMQGQTQTQEAILKDYVAYDGILFPSIKEGTQMGQKITSKLIEVTINKGVSEEDFN
ncbi:peptidase M16 [Mangrovimonas yunxiaonensis]|uniref:Peptidase M16 n=1 Tax=Mangrovimonas yunxiaonensis TaxID=1197477 RepID=A0A084TLB9_9FLAO|nr:pitrilysin family protein [Mangrovimonas yunxiaonensis]KFB01505.1 peptidase M16 [Mangrovimonas yunxiaonensis]MBR9758362.1 insulinase family protein [Algicola sp.]